MNNLNLQIMVKVSAESYFGAKKPVLENGWNVQNDIEKNKFMNLACQAWHDRDPIKWRSLSSFLLMDSASEYSFKIPHATFKKCYNRYVAQVEECIKEQRTISGRFKLIGINAGREPMYVRKIKTSCY